ncbi:glucose-1-phosphate thymidylyltransferase [Proteiniborus sp. DW1]|uniref:glucose-1-phosphate thymidylyltransferase n=1 Tax=Proteiniborus sp. DW1 TaxID=1889883 RepID=UPI00092DF3BE|nr:glucose-1-phosphate thymidylyltransferase [Proteiniborus sp. DW1]SCG83242.1 glucose-1-phosphate thymidylyltransferase [Proteiniborus sp. DW1]
MKGIILCGGQGAGLRPITHTIPKELIPVSNRPVLYYILDSLLKADITEIGIVISEHEEIFKSYLKEYEKRNLEYEFIYQHQTLGLADTIAITEDFVQDDDFIVIIGDNFYELNLKELIDDFYNSTSNCSIFLHKVEEPESFRIAEVKEKQVLSIEDKPKNPKSNLAVTGIYIFDKNIFKGCKEIRPSWTGEYEISDGIKWLIDNGYKVTYNISRSLWLDLGTPKDILYANQYILSGIKSNIKGLVNEKSIITGNVFLAENSKIYNSIIRGPVIIGSNTIIENSYIGPYTSIMNNVKIIDCQIENSIILDKCFITRVMNIIDSSIIGENTNIVSQNTCKRANSFILGNDSNIILY